MRIQQITQPRTQHTGAAVRFHQLSVTSHRRAMRALSAREVATTAPATTRIRTISANEDPATAKECAEVVGLALSEDPNNDFFAIHPSTHVARWQAICNNSLLRAGHVRMLHVLEATTGESSSAAATGAPGSSSSGSEQDSNADSGRVQAGMFAYTYPDEKSPDDGPEPPGVTDLSATSRPEAIPVRDEMLAYLGERKEAFHKTHGSFEYIMFLGVRPGMQGKGYGSRLLRHVTDKADAAGRWCYLEASTPDNARLYARHGFQTLETKTWTLDSLPGKRFMLIFMARPPQPPAAIN